MEAVQTHASAVSLLSQLEAASVHTAKSGTQLLPVVVDHTVIHTVARLAVINGQRAAAGIDSLLTWCYVHCRGDVLKPSRDFFVVPSVFESIGLQDCESGAGSRCRVCCTKTQLRRHHAINMLCVVSLHPRKIGASLTVRSCTIVACAQSPCFAGRAT